MNIFIYKSKDYTLQSNDSNVKTMFLLKHPASVTALVSMYINTFRALSSENLVLTTFLVRWEEGQERHQSAYKTLEKCSP